MRGPSDLIKLKVSTTRNIVMDLEQLENVPIFRSIVESIAALSEDLTIDQILSAALQEYINLKIFNEEFPYRTPGTTGPGTIYTNKVEVVSND